MARTTSAKPARNTPVKRAWRSLTWLGVITAVLTGILGLGVAFGGASWAPKLALDLEGGTQIVLGAQLESGQVVTQDQLDQAVSIIRDRIDAAGVSEAEVTTQGDRNVVVAIPGEPDEQTLARIQSSAKLEFRPVIYTDVAATSTVDNTGDSTATPSPEDTASPTPEPTESLSTTPTASPTDASDPNWVSPALYQEYLDFDCATVDESAANVAPAGEPLVTCDTQNAYKYLLGPVEVAGENIADASSGLVLNSQGVSTGQWGVFITFDGTGTEQFAAVTERLFGFPQTDPRNRFAIVLDGRIISAPTTQAIITDGKPQISGSFTQESAKTLADQLKFGALPIGFEVLSQEVISATLGSAQLASGLIAGLIGLILVVGYSVFQYRALASVTLASLVVAAVLTYLVIAIMSWRQGYRLSLAGVAGLIVAIGLTVDSFIVYFERIRDELRDGRSLEGAVEAGWKRALRTILAAKSINLISAIVLFILAVGNVRGFAFTLGITVVIDVIVVVLFTHPMLQLLAATRFFSSGHPASGLDPNALGAVYRGRAQFRAPVVAGKSGASREAARRQTIAERKAAELDGKDS
ncbi:protein translocase subunit SecD [Leifsonia sp. H3M29-4]|uniref:protein translocase subunit SecD n=1 Tax=Salinibacterium metalliresistens TaxID=3031321 RepID=UPI0023DAE34F|nr:protein translocase subunit SecD [Salinibacterium metalliresistens]MDF1479786.1 protein translocase subunit SecD [Salinibacterium metalliresistens]